MATKKAKDKAIKHQVDPVRTVVEDVEVFVGGSHEYKYVREKEDPSGIEIHSLFYSHNTEWSDHVRGSLALRIMDDGWGYKIEGETRHMDYSEAYEMHILLDLIQETPKYEIYKKIDGPNGKNKRDYQAMKIMS